MNAWTDYPITELGDTEGNKAPIRECAVLSYDRNKYCRVMVEGIVKEIKAGYLYQRPGRVGEAPPITRRQLGELPR